jgi:hypothetical protein
MLGCDGITARDTPAVQTRVDLVKTGVHGFQPVQTLAELGGKTLVCLYHVAEQGISAGGRAVEDVKEGCARGLLLESDVRVPGDGVSALLEELGACTVICAAEYQVDFGEAFGRA